MTLSLGSERRNEQLVQGRASLPWILNSFESFEKLLDGQASGELHQRRQQALSALLAQGLPTTKNEDWRYTNVSYLARDNYELPTKKSGRLNGEFLPPSWAMPHSLARLVFVDGEFKPELSLLPQEAAGLTVTNLSKLLQSGGTSIAPAVQQALLAKLGTLASVERQAFDAMNAAFLKDGVVVHLARNCQLERPIQCVFLTDATDRPAICSGRVLVVLEEGAAATLCEFHGTKGGGKFLKTQTSEVFLADNARFELVKVISENDLTDHFSSLHLVQGRDSRFRSTTFYLGGKTVRSEILPTLNGAGGNCELHGLTLAAHDELIDNFTTMNHAQPHCESTQLFKGIYTGKAHGVFCGTITVQQEAQKTNAFQRNASILLSNEAAVDTKPQLKIWADDVKCTHGATVGQLDESALFYLRSRGISRSEAQKMLLRAFAEEVTEKISDDKIHDVVSRLVSERLNELHL